MSLSVKLLCGCFKSLRKTETERERDGVSLSVQLLCGFFKSLMKTETEREGERRNEFECTVAVGIF